jgi:hypothetical protein
MTDNLLPLEVRLKQLTQSKKSDFPNQHDDYWNRYSNLVNSLRLNVYPNINAGLACLSKSPGLYTDHGEKHFDEVVRYAGLLYIDAFESEKPSLAPYELYLLLCAIRVHDAGNIDGREEHERKAYSILKTYGGEIQRDTAEIGLISEIAQAHGGYADNYKDKDTIGILLETTDVGPIEVRPRLIAAAVRFADEICEHSSRALAHHLNNGNMPADNELFHLYASSIVGAKPNRKNKTFEMRLCFDVGLLQKQYPLPKEDGKPQTFKFLTDDAFDRIAKLNNERVYCNRFLLPHMQIDALEITIEFKREISPTGFPIRQSHGKKNITIRDVGYPGVSQSWREELSDLFGETLSKKEWK